MKKIESALKLASEGFYIFPLIPETKEPRYKGWQEAATRDPSIINEWWQEDPDYNVGIFTERYQDGGHLIAVDVDVKDGKPGKASWSKLSEDLELPLTRKNDTPSGGMHFIFASHEPVSGSIEKIDEGLDIRAKGNYIVGPGSTFEGNTYKTDDAQIALAPQSLIDVCGRPREPIVHKCELEHLDTPGILEKAIRYLRDAAPKAIEGRGGDGETFKVAAHVKDLGVSESMTVELMMEHWNESKAEPPWDEAELAKKVGNAYQYGDNPIGVHSPEADFADKIEVPEELKKPPRQKLYSIKVADMKVDLDSVDLVQGMLTENAMSIVIGEPGSGKTFLTLKLGYCIATGRPFANRRVQQGAVVYIAAEAATSITPRIEALKIHYENADFPMAVVPCPVNLLDEDADTDELIRIIKKEGEDFGMTVQFIVIDTLSRAMPGGNENSPDDMTAFVGNVDKIRNETDGHICVVHHLGKDKARGARGHSSLMAATDSAFEIANNQLKTTKQRDREGGSPIAFELITHGIGTNAYGEEVTSCVLQEIDAPAEEDFEDTKLTDKQQAGKDVLADLAQTKNPVDLTAWKEQLERTTPFQKFENEESLNRTVRKVRTQLADAGVLSYDKQKQLLTYIADEGADGADS